MGLNAVVFKSASRLKREYSREFEVVDEETGEAAAIDDKPPLSLAQLLAGDTRLGNAAQVVFLSEAVASALGPGTFIAETILYSGTHSGDCIPIGRLPLLREELGRLKRIDDGDVAAFVSTMEALIAVAEQEGNPIVFV